MKSNLSKHFLRKVMVPSFALLILPGCVTSSEQRAQLDEDLQIMNERIEKVNGKMEGLEMEIQRLQTQLDSVQSGQSRLSDKQQQVLQTSLADFDRRIASIETGRARDKQEIVDRLSTKMADIVKSSAPPPSRTQKTPKRNPSDTGYEHVVKSGETLSHIASAYGVSVQTIMDNNDIAKPEALRVGQKLFIPE